MCRNCVNEADKFAGSRIRKLRRSRGFSQSMLADVLGVSFQQIQKYERGQNRVSIGKIYLIAGFFNVSVLYFLNIPDDEIEILKNYRECTKDRKKIILALSQTYSQEEGEGANAPSSRRKNFCSKKKK